ncbi:hypothetical protein NQ314_020397 [Rhamnusium bicolor]|uniref:Uncharacterized protein n=1 Tax=Rhamnusium bicolor TaxID=1586634 RepID=A0AAV8WKZ8_9CUCU|nr:hypothetical protein NQ314_020397 [Rhamnusium bicolor]
MVVLGRTLVLLSAIIIAECKEKNNMYMENSGSEDMEMSASGYDYQTHSGRPFGYSHSSDSNKFNNFQYPPLGYGYYKYQPLPLRSTPLSPNYVPGHYERLFNSYGVPLSYAAYAEPVKGYENLMDPTNTGYVASPKITDLDYLL